ncbi:MAG: exosortase A [Motiliproteus sp.]
MNQNINTSGIVQPVSDRLSPYQKVLLVLPFIAFFLLFWPSLISMAAIWYRSDTYAHGMLVPLISIWLIWRSKAHWQRIEPGQSLLAVAAVGIGSLIWLLGIAADITVLHQLAAVGVLIALVAAQFGLALFRALLFPLGYLLFMVPFGDELTPALQQITADITVQALRFSGIPVYINGLFIEIPTGRFEVAEACSGIRYLIASVAVSVLYAYLTYQQPLKRGLFILASFLVPILANGIRAYGIVLIAHLSDMKYATGVDHLIYGWLFFGLVMALMFWVGSYWRDAEPPLASKPLPPGAAAISSFLPRRTSTALTLAIFFLIAFASTRLSQSSGQALLPAYQSDLAPWAIMESSNSDWQPNYVGADQSTLAFYQAPQSDIDGSASADTDKVGLYIADYQSEQQDKELVNQMNQINSADHWSMKSRSRVLFTQAGVSLPVTVTELRHVNGTKRRVWHWYRAYNQLSSSVVTTKLWQALNRFNGSPHPGSVYIVSNDYVDSQRADRLLSDFVSSNWPRIDQKNAALPHTNSNQASQ